MKVVEIFTSIEGEGRRVGEFSTFIRLFGCNLNCSYCDTPYGKDKEYEGEAKEMSIDEIVSEVCSRGVTNVTLTGGEPLIHGDIKELINLLCDHGFEVNVETNGTIVPPVRRKSVFYTIDFKTDASGMSDKMNLDVYDALGGGDVIKCVVGSIDDIVQSLEFLKKYKHILPIVYFSPVFGKIEPAEIVDFLKDNRIYDYRVQVQLHKVIWNKDKRGV